MTVTATAIAIVMMTSTSVYNYYSLQIPLAVAKVTFGHATFQRSQSIIAEVRFSEEISVSLQVMSGYIIG